MTYFKDQLDQLNKWEHLRLPLFRNEEVGVKLVALTKPVDDSMLIHIDIKAWGGRIADDAETQFQLVKLGVGQLQKKHNVLIIRLYPGLQSHQRQSERSYQVHRKFSGRVAEQAVRKSQNFTQTQRQKTGV